MTGPGVGPWLAHALRCHDAPAAATALNEAARGKEGPVDVWGPEHWKDAVAVFVRNRRTACTALRG
eukprot:7268066-Lingulodinium_polyedra.AAC.1